MSSRPHQDVAPQTFDALSRLIQRVAPWLVDVGTWMFGGLIALNLVAIAALITVGPIAVAVLVSVAAFACAFPLEVAGMVLLRISKDVEEIHLDSLAQRSFAEARFPHINAYFPTQRQQTSNRERRTRITLGYALVLAAVSVVLTLTGVEAALWHMARWIAEASMAATALSVGLIVLAVASSMPPPTKAEQRLKRSYRAESNGEQFESTRDSESVK